jgi:hypothetical protein
MTMPLLVDKFEYFRILRDDGVAPDVAEVYADALASGLVQEIVLPVDLTLLAARIEAGVDRRLRSAQRLNALIGAVIVATQIFIVAKLYA